MEYSKFEIDKKTIQNKKNQQIKTEITYNHYPNYFVKKEIYKPIKSIESIEDSETIVYKESSRFKTLVSALLIMVFMCTIINYTKLETPNYIKEMYVTMINKNNKDDSEKISKQGGKIIGEKKLVKKEINKNTQPEESEIDNSIKENENFAESIKNSKQSSENNNDNTLVMNETEDNTKQVIAKNMSRGNDKIYITNRTDLEIEPENYLKVEYPIEKVKRNTTDPAVLIIHTHGTEAYIDTGTDGNTRNNDIEKNVVKIGEELANILRTYGIPTIHSKTMHDEISYVRSYEYSKKEAQEYLRKYPSIKYVIDIHRDALGTEEEPVKTYAEINGEKAAQLMFVMGTNASGGDHPDYKSNLTTAMHLQKNANMLFPDLMRPVNIRPIIFNQNLAKGCMILEVGSDANTISEAITAIRMFGRVLAETI